MKLIIQEFEAQYTAAVIDLILAIQVDEFGVAISREDQPDLLHIPEYYQASGGQFWLAFINEELVGCVSLKVFANAQAALRKCLSLKLIEVLNTKLDNSWWTNYTNLLWSMGLSNFIWVRLRNIWRHIVFMRKML